MKVTRNLTYTHEAICKTLKNTNLLERIDGIQVRIEDMYIKAWIQICDERKERNEITNARIMNEEEKETLAKEAYERYKDMVANEIAYYM